MGDILDSVDRIGGNDGITVVLPKRKMIKNKFKLILKAKTLRQSGVTIVGTFGSGILDDRLFLYFFAHFRPFFLLKE